MGLPVNQLVGQLVTLIACPPPPGTGVVPLPRAKPNLRTLQHDRHLQLLPPPRVLWRQEQHHSLCWRHRGQWIFTWQSIPDTMPGNQAESAAPGPVQPPSSHQQPVYQQHLHFIHHWYHVAVQHIDFFADIYLIFILIYTIICTISFQICLTFFKGGPMDHSTNQGITLGWFLFELFR